MGFKLALYCTRKRMRYSWSYQNLRIYPCIKVNEFHYYSSIVFCKNETHIFGCAINNTSHSCQNMNRIVNRFLIFLYCVSYCIMYCKIHKHLIKFIKKYKYTYIKRIFIINFEYIQLMTNLFITYIIIFNKLTK